MTKEREMAVSARPDELARSLADPVAVRARLDRQQEALAYYQSHHPEIVEKYRGQWVAITGSRIAWSTTNFKELMERLAGLDEGFLVQYVAGPDDCLVL